MVQYHMGVDVSVTLTCNPPLLILPPWAFLLCPPLGLAGSNGMTVWEIRWVLHLEPLRTSLRIHSLPPTRLLLRPLHLTILPPPLRLRPLHLAKNTKGFRVLWRFYRTSFLRLGKTWRTCNLDSSCGRDTRSALRRC
jgi:hypothetical protein